MSFPLPSSSTAPSLPSRPPVGDAASFDSREPFAHRLLRALTNAALPYADLRDLPRGDLDAMPDGFLTGALKFGKPDLSAPQRLALPVCSAATINRCLSELPNLEICSVEGIAPGDDVVDLSLGPRLRLFETPQPSPRLRNEQHVPVLHRPPCSPPTFLPRVASPLADTPAGCVEGLRLALAREDHRLELATPAAFFRSSRVCERILDQAKHRLESGRDALTAQEASQLAALVRQVPRELLPAPAAVLVARMEKQLETIALRERHLLRLTQLVGDLRDVACPRRHRGLQARSPEDLITLAKMWLWAWPDSAGYAQAAPLSDLQKRRHDAAKLLKHGWEGAKGLDSLRDSFLKLGVPLPDADLLRRMKLQASPHAMSAHPMRWRP